MTIKNFKLIATCFSGMQACTNGGNKRKILIENSKVCFRKK